MGTNRPDIHVRDVAGPAEKTRQLVPHSAPHNLDNLALLEVDDDAADEVDGAGDDVADVVEGEGDVVVVERQLDVGDDEVILAAAAVHGVHRQLETEPGPRHVDAEPLDSLVSNVGHYHFRKWQWQYGNGLMLKAKNPVSRKFARA